MRCEELEIKGTLLIANEGINGTISGAAANIDSILGFLSSIPEFADLVWKLSTSPEQPFARLKVRLKREIVTMGQPGVDPRGAVGQYIEPEDWNDFISAEDVVVIDTRNDYEVSIGTFDGAIDPKTKSFREFPSWWEDNKQRFANQKVAMFCTGGIRCEKASVVMLNEGYEEVYQINGGILNYFEKTGGAHWDGECFVFDRRVGVLGDLSETDSEVCWACREPLTPEQALSPDFVRGVSCPYCIE